MTSNYETGVRYVIVDKETEEIDWDCRLHSSRESAIDAMCTPSHSFVRTEAELDEDHTLWSEVYEIRRVLPAIPTTEARCEGPQ